jgi:hypothetical protein
LFKSAGLQKYFTVDYTDQEHDEYSEDEEEANTDREDIPMTPRMSSENSLA